MFGFHSNIQTILTPKVSLEFSTLLRGRLDFIFKKTSACKFASFMRVRHWQVNELNGHQSINLDDLNIMLGVFPDLDSCIAVKYRALFPEILLGVIKNLRGKFFNRIDA